jgi:ParB family transcriptional regulator, chromosome partitioning protein
MPAPRKDEIPFHLSPADIKEIDVAIDAIDPDPDNRRIEDDEELAQLVDSVRVLGIQERVKLVAQANGRYRLFDGERRWTAAKRAGLAVIPAKVWPVGTDPRWTIEIGLALHETRVQPGCLNVARRLRQLKNQYGETTEQIAARTGIAAKRVGAYLTLFDASDFLLRFFDDHDVPLHQGVEFVRYERAAGEAAARALAKRYMEEPLSVREIAAMRKRKTGATEPAQEKAIAPTGKAGLVNRVAAALKQDEDGAVSQLREVLGRHGYVVVRAEGR